MPIVWSATKLQILLLLSYGTGPAQLEENIFLLLVVKNLNSYHISRILSKYTHVVSEYMLPSFLVRSYGGRC